MARPLGPWKIGGHVVEVFRDPERWLPYERQLIDHGVGIPLTHRLSWIQEVSGDEVWFIVARNEQDESLSAGFPLIRSRVRSLPRHSRLRVTSLGYAIEDAGLFAALEALQLIVRDEPRILGVSAEVFVRDPGRRNTLEQQLASQGYEKVRRARRYTRTPQLDLLQDEENLLMSFSPTCRRFIRAPAKKGFVVDRLQDTRWAPRMSELWEETFARTDSEAPDRDWHRHLAFARNHPDEYRIMGVFGPSQSADAALLAFSCAHNNVDHAVYSDGASTRGIGASMALSYAPLWELMRWAKEQGCPWFDLGGISPGSYGDVHDPRGGISDFKRRFTDTVIEVGGEWEAETSSWKATFSDRVSSSKAFVRRLLDSGGSRT